MTFGWFSGIGLAIEVTDVYLMGPEGEEKKCIWVVFYLPFVRIGFLI